MAEEDVDLIVIGGDICWGPMPRETLELLQALEDTHFVLGNADREVGSGRFEPAGEDHQWVAEVNAWCHAQLSEEQRRFLQELPPLFSLEDEALGSILFCHGSPRSDEEAIRSSTPDQEIAAMLHGVEADVIVCGHTHEQSDRVVEGKRVVNAGSVGLPYDDRSAAWLLIDAGLTLKRTEYDYAETAKRILETSVPHASIFAEHLASAPEG